MEDLFSSVLLPVNIGLIMFGMGLSLKKNDFSMLLQNPRTVVVGLLIHMLMMPAVAFIISLVIPLSPAFKIGLILVAACPGGTVSNLVTYWLKGNIALCLVLTTLTSFLIIVTLPLLVNFALLVYTSHEVSGLSLSLQHTFVNVGLIILLPVYLGTLFRKLFPAVAKKIEKPLEASLTILLGVVYAGIIILHRQSESAPLMKYIPLFVAAFALNAVSMFGAYYTSRKFSLDNRNSYTISMQVGLQDTALAIFVASTLMRSNELAIVPVAYGSFTFFTTFIFGYFYMKYGEKSRDK